jgi:hypothetical protein
VQFFNPAEGEVLQEGAYDFALTLDAVHDMTHPESVLASVRRALKVRTRRCRPSSTFRACKFATP